MPILPFSSLFHVLFQLLLLRRVGWLFSGSWAMFSQRLPWHLHRLYFSCLCLLAARVCQGEKRCKYVPFLCLSLIISCFRVEGLALQEGLGWGGRAAPPSRRRNMSFGNNLLSFILFWSSFLLLVLQRRRGSRFRESWAAYLL